MCDNMDNGEKEIEAMTDEWCKVDTGREYARQAYKAGLIAMRDRVLSNKYDEWFLRYVKELSDEVIELREQIKYKSND
jgi:hypothetical protein